MNFDIRRAFPFGLFCITALTSCGTTTGTASSGPPPTTNLNGNWKLTGDSVSGPLPALSAAMIVVDNQVTASLAYTISCGSGTPATGAWAQLTGPIAADGSFTATNPGFPLPAPKQFTITGHVPNAGNAWRGSYSIVSNTPGCNVNQSGIFVATSIPSVSGTYTGSISGTNAGANGTISMQLVEGSGPAAMTGAPLPVFVFPYFPLSGTITVNGSSCFSQGSTSSAPNSISPIPGSLAGNSYSLFYAMNDGSTLLLNGDLIDPTGSKLFSVIGGNCNGAQGTVTLARQ